MKSKEQNREKIGEIIGEASMCWSETPTGVFESDKACTLIDRVMEIIYGAENKKEDYSNDVCVCLHARKLHGKSHSVNYTEGLCKTCNCKNFMMK